jgi:ADP-heptose:LPS heptosyltransferase
MLEPTVKAVGHGNKAWLLTYWSQLATKLQAAKVGPLIQCNPLEVRALPGAATVKTPSFRHAVAVLSVCRALVTTEGGLMHAAAAVGVPAVVVFGGFISPEVTGYSLHRNLFSGDGLGCGMRSACDHCRRAMARITPAMVHNHLRGLLEGNP